MTEDEWIENRILRKATQRSMFEDRDVWRDGEKVPKQYCVLFREMDDAQKQLLENTIGEMFYPVLALWCNDDLWTVLGTRDIWSYYGGKLYQAKLDEIDGDISLVEPGGVKKDYLKFEASFLRLNKASIEVWASKAPEYFSFWSVLNMFPIRKTNAPFTNE
ncbi:hypothetical protein JD969_04220 [Planctomycetota bacterium]|nr:hypothetical protein JD969_04220 [Planctomycetota bacterium]